MITPNLGNPTPPTIAERLVCAKSVLDPSSCRLYRLDGTNSTERGTVDLDTAVLSGRAYFGRTLPHVWAIDIDDPEHDAFDYLLDVLGSMDVEHIVFDSGSQERPGRHVFVQMRSDDPDRQAIRQTVEGQFQGGRIDWRMQAGGSPIRPPLGLHRNGTTWSEPVNMDRAEAIETLERWHAEAGATGVACVLPLWAEALRRGDYAECERLGKRVARHSGKVDRSAVDLSIGLAYRNAGLTAADYVSDLSGRWPSPKAIEQQDPARYLRRQWADVMRMPDSHDPTRAGLDRLDSYQQAITDDPDLTKTQRLVLYAFCEAARTKQRTTLGLSWSDLQELTGLSRTAIGRVIGRRADSQAVRRFVAPAGREPGQVQTYRLLVPETVKRTTSLPVTLRVTERVVARLTGHPLFWNRRGALRPSGYQTLLTFAEPKPTAEAMRCRVGVSLNTWKARAAELIAEGAVIPTGDDCYAINPHFDWDDLAERRGLLDVEANYLYSRTQERHARVADIAARGWLTVDEADRRHAHIDERHQALGRYRRYDLRQADTPDPHQRGEITGFRGPESNCAACGLPSNHREASTGLLWHEHCDMPRWQATLYGRQGIAIPAERIATRCEPATVDRHGLDWSDGEVDADTVWAVAA